MSDLVNTPSDELAAMVREAVGEMHDYAEEALDELTVRASGFAQAVMRADEAEEALRRERGLE